MPKCAWCGVLANRFIVSLRFFIFQRPSCRYYASQQTFVSRFVSDPAHLSDGSQRVMGVTSLHPKASDQGSYYFGFIPKHDNQLSTQVWVAQQLLPYCQGDFRRLRFNNFFIPLFFLQAFLLRTRSRDTWLSWCKFLSKMVCPDSRVLMLSNNVPPLQLYGGSSANPQTPGQKSESASFASPEVIGGVTPPYGQRQQPAAQSDFLTEVCLSPQHPTLPNTHTHFC